MYRINQITNYFNYEENVVVTSLFTKNENGELYCKSFSLDKSKVDMDSLVKTWSLTTLCINTEKTQSELTTLFGESFKHCFVRFINNRTNYDFKNKVVVIDSLLEVSLKSDFSSPELFDLHSELPIFKSEEFEKNLELESLVGYKKV